MFQEFIRRPLSDAHDFQAQQVRPFGSCLYNKQTVGEPPHPYRQSMKAWIGEGRMRIVELGHRLRSDKRGGVAVQRLIDRLGANRLLKLFQLVSRYATLVF